MLFFGEVSHLSLILVWFKYYNFSNKQLLNHYTVILNVWAITHTGATYQVLTLQFITIALLLYEAVMKYFGGWRSSQHEVLY